MRRRFLESVAVSGKMASREVDGLGGWVMAKYRVAWLPGDGVGPDVLAASRIVLDRIGLDAEYLPGDVGWEFWRREGDALPARTIELLGNTDCALFGAVTSKTKSAAEEELDPRLQGKGFSYRSPLVRIRQLLDLFVCLRPCKAFPGNPLNYRDDIDLVVFRENTEDLYAGIEFNGVPPEMASLPGMDRVPPDAPSHSRSTPAAGPNASPVPAFEYARKHGRRRVTCVHKPNVVRVSDGLFLDTVHQVAHEYPDIAFDNAAVDAMCMSMTGIRRTTMSSWPRTSTATSSQTWRRSLSGDWVSAARATSASTTPSSSRPTDPPRNTPARTRPTPSPRSWPCA
jgi:3-isopropylmalate dehydrogenase